MKFISWNVNGIRAAWNHGLPIFLSNHFADIYAFQETRTSEEIPIIALQGYEAYWSFCKSRKGYSGTLCLTKRHPLNVWTGFEDKNFDCEGRLITMEFEAFFFVNCYVPNSQASDMRYDYRNAWDEKFIDHLKKLKRQKSVVVCGDFNVPISDDDVYDGNQQIEQNTDRFQSTERENLLTIIDSGYIDTYRFIHPDERGKYTWWSNRRFKRKENRGWRLDYFLTTEDLQDSVVESTMFCDVLGSDHCPIFLELHLASEPSNSLIVKGRLRRTNLHYADIAGMDEQEYTSIVNYANMKAIWDSIDWDNVEKHVADMQMALAKVAYSRNLRKIEKWQKRIINSLDAKLLAVRHVCSTGGGPGVDGIKWTTPHEKITAALSLTAKDYHALPSRLLIIKTKNGKERRVHVETYFDRAMQTLYALALDPIAESWGDRKSFAYRKGRSMADVDGYIKYIFSGDDAPEWLFIGDIRKCYENISHEWIKNHIPMAPYVLNQFLNAGYAFGGKLFPMDVGVGIGLGLSPIIANMTLDGMQDFIYDKLSPNSSIIDFDEGNLIRFADDVIISARSEASAKKISYILSEFLSVRGLELSDKKCRIVNVKDGFDFMSRHYTKRGDKLMSRPSDMAVERFKKSLKETIDTHMGSQKSLIQKINRKIDGWVTYHKVSEAEPAFRHIDVFLKASLLASCENKHPKWPRKKLLEKYWFKDREGRYCYALQNKKEVRIKFLSDALLIDYFPVKTNVNPYIDTAYLEKRTHERAIFNSTGVYRAIWNRQDGYCYYCGRKILRDAEKALVEVDARQSRKAARYAYVHKRCLDAPFDIIEAEVLPSSNTDIMRLLAKLEANKQTSGMKYTALSEFFRTCEKPSVTLTFKEIEAIIGEKLGKVYQTREYWYATGFSRLSQCWLENGYTIKTLHLEGKKRVVFHLTDDTKGTTSVAIPDVIKHGRIPMDAKYELENYFNYIIKKYGL